MKKILLKLCLLVTVVMSMACGLGKGPVITADGFRVVECVASHYQELNNAGDLMTVAAIVATQCEAESAQLVVDIFGATKRGLHRSGVRIE